VAAQRGTALKSTFPADVTESSPHYNVKHFHERKNLGVTLSPRGRAIRDQPNLSREANLALECVRAERNPRALARNMEGVQDWRIVCDVAIRHRIALFCWTHLETCSSRRPIPRLPSCVPSLWRRAHADSCSTGR
jgi:hypothetical protein